jgi:hypothetical protein
MQNNKEFNQLLELMGRYEVNPTKAQKEEVQDEASRLIINGWATPSLRVVFDFGIEKYRTMGLNSLETVVYDKDTYTDDGIEYANLCIKNRFLSFNPTAKTKSRSPFNVQGKPSLFFLKQQEKPINLKIANR